MTFKKGKSGNPNGRPKGVMSKRVQLAKLLEPRAAELIDKMIELALGGDGNALRLCIERLIPKAQREATEVDLPSVNDERNIAKLNDSILQAVFNGQMSVGDAEKLMLLIKGQLLNDSTPLNLKITTNDPVEASRIYQKIMMGK